MSRTLLAGRSLASVLLSTLSTPAQDLRWDIPEGSAVVYHSECRGRTRDVKDTRDRPRYTSLAEGDHGASLFFAVELDKDRSHLTQPVYFFNDLWLHLATDLRHARRGGKRRVVVEIGSWYRDYVAEARYQKPDAEGWQKILVKLAPLRDKPRDKHGWGRGLSGTFTLTRKIAAGACPIPEFRCEGDLTLRNEPDDKPRVHKGTYTGKWTFRRISQRGAVFEKRVDATIREQLAGLRQKLSLPYSKRGVRLGPRPEDKKPEEWFGPGYHALAVLTLIKAGDRQDPITQRALADLRRMNITETYSLACAIMALEAYYAPAGERAQLRQGKLKRPVIRKLSPADQKLVQEWTDRILHNHDVRKDPAYLLRFRYHRGTSYDNSASQYAMLGLYSALLCGAKISPQTWFATAAHWLEQLQEVGDKKFRLQVSGAGSLALPAKRRTVASLPAAIPVGWGYWDDSVRTSSMTAAGITGLTICKAAFERLKIGPRKLRQQLEDRQRGGLLWLSRRFTMRAMLRDGPRSMNHEYYNLFGLERAFELNQIELLDGRDWYFEGAHVLLNRLENGGRWGKVHEVCFAILFLKKGVSGPVVPITQSGRR